MTQQTWNPGIYEKNARYVSDLGMPVVELLDPQPGERILDLGCGDGVLTKTLKEQGCELVGVDSSSELVAAALALGLDVSEQDARQITFEDEFDAVFTNAVLHWIKEAHLVVQNVYRALRAGGRFVGEFGGHGNCEAIEMAIVTELGRRGLNARAANPWYFPTAEGYRNILKTSGFEVTHIELIPRSTPLPEGMLGFLETFAGSFTALVPIDQRETFLSDVCERLEPLLKGSNGEWSADYVRLRFQAFKVNE